VQPFVLWNVSDVVVQDFSIWQPQLWSFNIMNGTDISVTNLYVNATATKAPSGYNWVQNTDGFGKSRLEQLMQALTDLGAKTPWT
jgi:galacturan 1,4-alpha-galacturonidase